MPAPLSYPGVYIEEVPSGARPIEGVETSIALFIGWARRGPAGKAVRIASFVDFDRLFGGCDPDSYLGYGVSHFFANGGRQAFVIRIEGAGAATATGTLPGPPALRIRASSSGSWSNGVRVRTTAAGAGLIRLDVLDIAEAGQDDVLLESFDHLSTDVADGRYAPTLVNGQSSYIEVVEVASSIVDLQAPITVALQGGAPGKTPEADEAGFIASVLRLFEPGQAADAIALFNLICVPGLTEKAALENLQRVALARRAFLICDCARESTVQTVATTLPKGQGADHSAFYFSWVLAPDPKRAMAVRPFPPSGFMAGLYARTDSQRGVWKAPAGMEAGLFGASGPSFGVNDRDNGVLNVQAVNAIRSFPSHGTVAWGARTCAGFDGGGSDFKYVPVRRLALHIEESLYRGLAWATFEPNDEPLWAQIRVSAAAFMNTLFRQGAFQGATPGQAYFVKCDSETTPPSQVDVGAATLLIGFAPLKPAEFLVLTITQMAGRTEA